ncbi:MAG: alpha/beta hydrolase [Bacteroidetes bacterium]|nr:MAG: alpha/beta hydrolase [Bacteroidota bacterium]RLD83706.1 MAG: alpha/beta hydrolase [Bacteroidota bacterium]
MELFFRKYGEGTPIVIVHGLYGSSDNWVTIGRRLAENFEVFIIDQRNHGRSPHSKLHNYDLMVDDLYNFLEKQDIKKAVLVGHSMGGKTVMQFAYQYSEKVSALIVLDIVPKSYVQIAKKNESEISHYGILKAMKDVNFSIINNRKDVDRELEKVIKNIRIRQFLLKNIHRDKDNSLSWGLNVEALYNGLDEILNGMDTGLYHTGDAITGFPVLFIRGANSKYILDGDIERIETIFPYAELKTIDNAGHWLHAEQPQKLVSLIEDFLN